ncbi:MAG: S26 family signal peptidase [Pseudomonadota bacterium]
MSVHATDRARLNRGWRRVGFCAAVLTAAVAAKTAMHYERSWYISFNWTESLPFWVFYVDETETPQVGDYIDFWPPDNPYYADISFVKRVAAGPGDKVACRGRAFFVDNEQVAIAKIKSQGGDPLVPGPCGVVPAGHFFVVAPHKDSFDSRYEVIGHVPRERVRGVAVPLL